MDVEELIGKPNEKKNNSDYNLFINNLGFIIFFFLSLFLIGVSAHFELNVVFILGRVASLFTIYGLIYLFLTYIIKTKYAINYSSIIPILIILTVFWNAYKEKDQSDKINLFNKNLKLIETKWINQNPLDASVRNNYRKEVNDYIDLYMSSLGGEHLEKMKKIKELKNEQFDLENKFFDNLKKIHQIDPSFLHKNLELINQYIDSTQKMLNHIKKRKEVPNEIIKGYKLHITYGEGLKKIGEIYHSYVNDEITEKEKNSLIDQPLKNLLKTEKKLFDQ